MWEIIGTVDEKTFRDRGSGFRYMSVLAFIGACLIGMWIFSYLGDRQEGKSKKKSYDEAGKHIGKQGPGLVVYIVVVFVIGGVLSLLFG